MKNNLYYEYQFLTKDWKNVKCEFIKTNKIDPKWFRVKYLDQADIESLGWLNGETRGMTPFIFNELDPDNEFQLYYQFDNQFAQIYNCHSDFVFQGTIKNKSQLKFIMTCHGK